MWHTVTGNASIFETRKNRGRTNRNNNKLKTTNRTKLKINTEINSNNATNLKSYRPNTSVRYGSGGRGARERRQRRWRVVLVEYVRERRVRVRNRRRMLRCERHDVRLCDGDERRRLLRQWCGPGGHVVASRLANPDTRLIRRREAATRAAHRSYKRGGTSCRHRLYEAERLACQLEPTVPAEGSQTLRLTHDVALVLVERLTIAEDQLEFAQESRTRRITARIRNNNKCGQLNVSIVVVPQNCSHIHIVSVEIPTLMRPYAEQLKLQVYYSYT